MGAEAASVFRDGCYRDVMLLPQPSGKNDVDDDVSNIMQFQYSFGRCKIFLTLHILHCFNNGPLVNIEIGEEVQLEKET